MSNRICKLLGIKYPIIQGAMQWLSVPQLAAAVSKAGGLGCITAATFNSKEDLGAAIRDIRQMTDKPFVVNISLLSHVIGKQKINELMEVILEEKPPVVETAGSTPEEYLPRLKAAGICVIHKVPAVRFAKKAESLGVDAVTVVGNESGGHPGLGDTTSMVLIPKAARTLSIPLIAGGGIADGAGLAAALSLGADGVVMGTRFMASEECPLHPAFQQVICDCNEEDTMLIQHSIKRPLRVWNNATAQRAAQMEAEGVEVGELMTVIGGNITKRCYQTGEVQNCAFPLGQCAGLVYNVMSVRDILEETMRDADRILCEARDRIAKNLP